jgi:hypothetical protein
MISTQVLLLQSVQAPSPEAVDDLVKFLESGVDLANRSEHTQRESALTIHSHLSCARVFQFNCQMGRGRTTTGMCVCVLICSISHTLSAFVLYCVVFRSDCGLLVVLPSPQDGTGGSESAA